MCKICAATFKALKKCKTCAASCQLVNNLAYSVQRLAYSFKLTKCLYELNEKFKTKSEKHNLKFKTFLHKTNNLLTPEFWLLISSLRDTIHEIRDTCSLSRFHLPPAPIRYPLYAPRYSSLNRLF